MAYDIRLVKLINGETVLGKWDEAAGNWWTWPCCRRFRPSRACRCCFCLRHPFETEVGGDISLTHVLYEYRSAPKNSKPAILRPSAI